MHSTVALLAAVCAAAIAPAAAFAPAGGAMRSTGLRAAPRVSVPVKSFLCTCTEAFRLLKSMLQCPSQHTCRPSATAPGTIRDACTICLYSKAPSLCSDLTECAAQMPSRLCLEACTRRCDLLLACRVAMRAFTFRECDQLQMFVHEHGSVSVDLFCHVRWF
jgi:hypothetical protein